MFSLSVFPSKCDPGKCPHVYHIIITTMETKRIHEILEAFHSGRLESLMFNWQRGFLIKKSQLLYGVCPHTGSILQRSFCSRNQLMDELTSSTSHPPNTFPAEHFIRENPGEPFHKAKNDEWCDFNKVLIIIRTGSNKSLGTILTVS